MKLCVFVALFAAAAAYPTDCTGLADGIQTIAPDGSNPVRARCVQGYYVIIDASDSRWSRYFSSWASHSGNIYGPSKGEMTSRETPAASAWANWFRVRPHGKQPKYYKSDCSSVDKSTEGQAYYATGNFMSGCYYFNRNCDFNGSCRKCKDNYGPNPNTHGTCPFKTEGAHGTYPFGYRGCGAHWWNRFPSLPKDKTHCMAYSPQAPPPTPSPTMSPTSNHEAELEFASGSGRSCTFGFDGSRLHTDCSLGSSFTGGSPHTFSTRREETELQFVWGGNDCLIAYNGVNLETDCKLGSGFASLSIQGKGGSLDGAKINFINELSSTQCALTYDGNKLNTDCTLGHGF